MSSGDEPRQHVQMSVTRPDVSDGWPRDGVRVSVCREFCFVSSIFVFSETYKGPTKYLLGRIKLNLIPSF